MPEKSFRLYPYRWVVLAVFMFINLTIQMLWIAYSPINNQAMEFYGVETGKIGLLLEVFMIAFIPFSIPVSWAIDKYGFKFTVGIGVVLMSLFGVARGFTGNNYNLALISTIGIAIAQPFLLNAWTKMPAQWFGVGERATAVGLVTLANLVGTALGMVLTPELTKTMSIPSVNLLYGGLAAFSAVLFLIFAREKPATPPCPPGEEVRALMLDGLKHAFKVKSFWLYLAISFIGMGIFNGIMNWVEPIVRVRNFSSQAGTLGALMLVGGIIGAVVIPPISDKLHKRKIFILLGFILAIPGLVGLTFANTIWLLYISAFAFGFFIISVSPIGMQYASEVTQPTPEGTSNGILQLFGQLSVVFVVIMERLSTPAGEFTPGLTLSIVLIGVSVLLIMLLKDPKVLKA